MKFILMSFVCAASAFAANAPKPKAAAPKADSAVASKDPFKTDDERSVYTIGYLMGRNVAPFNLTPAELKVAQSGLSDAALGKPALVDIRFHQSRVNDMLAKRMEGSASKEKSKGKIYVENFLKEHKAQAIPGGGWYLEVKAGQGAVPVKTDTIKANYRGTTVDGAQFDSSYDRGEATQFPLDGVIPCWTNGIGMMKVGGKAKLVCPSDVAYGDPGRPGIKPGATLIFDVELVEIVKVEKPKK